MKESSFLLRHYNGLQPPQTCFLSTFNHFYTTERIIDLIFLLVSASVCSKNPYCRLLREDRTGFATDTQLDIYNNAPPQPRSIQIPEHVSSFHL